MDAFWGALGALFGAITATLSYLAARRARHARDHAHEARKTVAVVEDAVNHRHQYDGDPPRLYDIALENRRRLNEAEFADANQFEQLDRLEQALAAHVRWEEGDDGKYGEVIDAIHDMQAMLNERFR